MNNYDTIKNLEETLESVRMIGARVENLEGACFDAEAKKYIGDIYGKTEEAEMAIGIEIERLKRTFKIGISVSAEALDKEFGGVVSPGTLSDNAVSAANKIMKGLTSRPYTLTNLGQTDDLTFIFDLEEQFNSNLGEISDFEIKGIAYGLYCAVKDSTLPEDAKEFGLVHKTIYDEELSDGASKGESFNISASGEVKEY